MKPQDHKHFHDHLHFEGHLHIEITNTRPEHFEALEAVQRAAFPTLTPEEILLPEKYAKHLELFPEGQFVALAHFGDKKIPVGSTSTFRTNFDFTHIQHTFLQAVANGWLTNHDPEGEWLYGADMSVHPRFHGLRIGSRLYKARQELARRLGLRGEIAGGMLPGYDLHRKKMSVPQYVLKVSRGKLTDPTLSMQIKNGFVVKGILYDHISDPRSNNCASLIVRYNTNYRETRQPVAIGA